MWQVQYAETIGWGSSWIGFRLNAYGQGLGSSFRFAGAVFRVKV